MTEGAGSTSDRIIDADGHVTEDLNAFSAYLPATYRREYEETKFLQYFPPLDHFHGMPMRIRGGERHGTLVGPADWVEFLNAVGIEKTVLYPTHALSYGKIRDRDWSIAVCRAYNEWLAETYLAHDERFQGMCVIPLQDPEAAVTELRHAVTNLGLRGAVLPSNGLGSHLGAKELWPVYEEAESLECAIAIHGGCHDGFGFDDLNVYAPVHALGHPFGQLIALGSFVFNGAFDRWPGLRVAFLEGGAAWILMAMERFSESYETHVPFNQRGELLKLKEGTEVGDYIRELLATGHICIGCEGGEVDMEYVVRRIGSSPFFYSSDFPHEVTVQSCLHEMAEFRELSLSDEERQATLSENAIRFYRL